MIPLFFYRNKVCIKATVFPSDETLLRTFPVQFFHLDNRVADPHHVDADPDPAFYLITDPDPTFHSDVDPDPNPDPTF